MTVTSNTGMELIRCKKVYIFLRGGGPLNYSKRICQVRQVAVTTHQQMFPRGCVVANGCRSCGTALDDRHFSAGTSTRVDFPQSCGHQRSSRSSAATLHLTCCCEGREKVSPAPGAALLARKPNLMDLKQSR